MKHLHVSLFLFLACIGYSQDTFNSEDYTVTKGDIETNSYKKDSTAHALVIYEIGNSYIDKFDFKLKTEVKKKIKILDKEGFNQATIIEDLYNNDAGHTKEKILDINAITSTIVDGKISRIKLEESQIFREKYNDNYTRIKFTLPNVTEGAVISYSYTLESPFIFKYKDWEFQHNIPTLHSEYRASIPGNYQYNIKLVGNQKLDINDSKLEEDCLNAGDGTKADCFVSRYVMKNIPAFVEEEFTTTKMNYLSRIDYELKTYKGFDGSVKNYTKTWKTTDRDLKTHQSIGRQLNKSNLVKDLLPKTITTEKDVLKKANAIFTYVQQNYTWNEKYNLFEDVSLKDVVSYKTGRASEINLLLYNLLADNGIDVKAVLVSTRAHGLATKVHPVITDFNYLLVQVTLNGKSYLLDAVDKYLTFGQISFRCLNQYGRLLDFENGSSWLPIHSDLSTKYFKVILTFNDDGTVKGAVETKKTGYYALASKHDYFNNGDNRYLDAFREKQAHLDITNHNVSTVEKTSELFKETFNVTIEPEIIDKNIYINPFLFKYVSENPFKLQERTYPIDFGYKKTYQYNFKLNLNNKYDVVELPKNLSMTLPNNAGTLFLTTQQSEDAVIVFLKVNFKEAIYNTAYYDYLKSFFSHIVQSQNNSFIILKEK